MNSDVATGYLIGQLAKNDNYKNQINGIEIIEYALNIILQAYEYVGGRFVLVECKNNEKLLSLYSKNSFIKLIKDDNNSLIQLFRLIKK